MEKNDEWKWYEEGVGEDDGGGEPLLSTVFLFLLFLSIGLKDEDGKNWDGYVVNYGGHNRWWRSVVMAVYRWFYCVKKMKMVVVVWSSWKKINLIHKINFCHVDNTC